MTGCQASLTQRDRRDEVKTLDGRVAEEGVVDHRNKGRDDEHHNPRIIEPPDGLRDTRGESGRRPSLTLRVSTALLCGTQPGTWSVSDRDERGSVE